jgi:hypothetical protein
MVHALCAISEDAGSTLIQRHFLDFLCAALPLDLNSIPITLEELVEILRRCLFIVLRRDTSLNKRLYQWLLNRPSDTTMLPINSAERDAELDFFKKHALKLVKIAIKNSLSLGTIEVPTLVNATIKYNTTKVCCIIRQ